MVEKIISEVLEYIQRQESRFITKPDELLERANTIKLTLDPDESSYDNYGKLTYYFSNMAAYHFLEGNENEERYFINQSIKYEKLRQKLRQNNGSNI